MALLWDILYFIAASALSLVGIEYEVKSDCAQPVTIAYEISAPIQTPRLKEWVANDTGCNGQDGISIVHVQQI